MFSASFAHPKMVDPHNVTDFNRNEYDTQEYALFCPAVAGKTAVQISPQVHQFIKDCRSFVLADESALPFELIESIQADGRHVLRRFIEGTSLGKHTVLTSGWGDMARDWANGKLDLRTCTTSDLEKYSGFSFKTSRFFLIHSRPDFDGVPIDTHWLKHFRKMGYEDVPDKVPTSWKQYDKWERAAKKLISHSDKTRAEYDLMVWLDGTKTEQLEAFKV